MTFKVITPAAAFPVTLAQARTHLRLIPYGSPAVHPDDDYINTVLIPSATVWVEQYLERALMTQTIEISLNAFDNRIYLPFGDVQSVTSVKYAINNVETTLPASVYSVNDYASPAYLYNKKDQVWPTPDAIDSCIKVRYVVGYTAVPLLITSAVYLIIGHLYENRQENVTGMTINELPMGVKSLLQPYRINVGA